MEFLSDDLLPLEFNKTHSELLNDVSGKKFGKIHEVRVVEGVRVLVSDEGFSLWFPEAMWLKFDVQVDRFLTKIDEGKKCWLADERWCFVKIDASKSGMDKKYSVKYFNENSSVVCLDSAVRFLKLNFFDNPQAYSESGLSSIGAHLKNGGVPFRIRLGGKFTLNYDI